MPEWKRWLVAPTPAPAWSDTDGYSWSPAVTVITIGRISTVIAIGSISVTVAVRIAITVVASAIVSSPIDLLSRPIALGQGSQRSSGIGKCRGTGIPTAADNQHRGSSDGDEYPGHVFS